MIKKTILITGSAGFIGFHVSKRLLDKGYKVIGVDNLNHYYDVKLKKARNAILQKNPNYNLYKGDISDLGFLKKVFSNKIDKVCHLAAQAGVRYSLVNPFIYIDSNIKGFLNVIDLASKNGVENFVFASSSSVYGNNKLPKKGFSEEDSVDNPISIYAATKKSNELMAYTYHHLYGLNCTGLRFFTVYGPWGRPDMAYFGFTKSIIEGKEIKIHGFGKMKRDVTYIDDVVDGILSSLDKKLGYEIINLGNSKSIELMDLVKGIEAKLGKKAKLNMVDIEPGELVETYANIRKAKKLLSFSPSTNFKEGISYFIDWYIDFYGKS